MYNRLLVEHVLPEACLLTILTLSSSFLSSTEVHPDCDDSSCSTDSDDSEDVCASLVFVLGSVSLLFLWKHNVFWNRLQNQFNTLILNLEHTVNVTTVFTCLQSNDNDTVEVLSSSVGVNHMLEKYLFRKTDPEYAVTDLEYSVDAHPSETNMICCECTNREV